MWLAYILIFYILFMSVYFFNSIGPYNFQVYNGIVKRRVKDNAYMVFTFMLLTILACLRAENVGSDTTNYILYFKEIGDGVYDNPFSALRFEPGFLLYLKILLYISDSPQIFIFTSSLIIMMSFGRFIRRYSRSIWLSVFIFFCLFFNTSMSAIRQYIAISILFFAFECILSRRFMKFLMYVCFAFLFHYSSIIFLIAYPLYNLKITRRRLQFFKVMLPIAIVVAMAVVVPVFWSLQSLGLFTYYSENTKYIEEGVKIATLLNMLIYVFLMTIPSRAWNVMKSKSNINDDPINRLCFIFGLVCILLIAVSFPFNLIDRFVHFFSVYLCVLIPNAVYELSKSRNVNFVNICIVCVLSASYLVVCTFRPEWSHVYPYSFY